MTKDTHSHVTRNKFFMKFCPIATNLKTLVRWSVHHTNFVYCWQKTIKMGIHATKGRFSINCCHKFTLFLRHIYI